MRAYKQESRVWFWGALVSIVLVLFLIALGLLFKPSVPPPSATVPQLTAIIEFTDEPLGNVVKHFAAASGREIVVAPEVAALRIGGKFSLGQVDSFLKALPEIMPVRVEVLSDKRILITHK